MVGAFLDVLALYEAGEADLPELQAQAATAAQALDNAHAELRRALADLADELELIRFTVLADNRPDAVRKAVRPVHELAPRPR